MKLVPKLEKLKYGSQLDKVFQYSNKKNWQQIDNDEFKQDIRDFGRSM